MRVEVEHNSGDTTRTHTITIVDDTDLEDDETFQSTLTLVTGESVTVSPATATVTIAGRDATGKPAITGVPQVGQTLTATAGNMADDDNLPTTTFPQGYSFQWVRTDADDMNPENITGATAATYAPVAADVGKKIRVKVRFGDGGGAEERLESDGTAAVVAAQESCATDRADSDWCATMTVGSTTIGSTTIYGYDTGNNGTHGALDDTTIDYGGGYTAVEIANVDNPGGGSRFFVYFNSFVPRGTVFDIGGAELVADALTRTSNTGQDRWDVTTRPGWTEGQKVTVSANLAPIVTAATVDGDQLTLTFAEDLDTGSKPAASAFTVYVDSGAGASPASVDTISGDEVTITLATAVTSGQAVTLDYAVPTSGPIQDESGIDAPAFTGRTVTNNTGNNVAGGAPAITGPAQAGMTLTADTSGIEDDDGVPASLNYQWVRITEGDVETNIGANASTYTLTAAEQGHNIRVDVSFTDNEGNAEGPLPSGETFLVMPALSSNCGADTFWCGVLTVGHHPRRRFRRGRVRLGLRQPRRRRLHLPGGPVHDHGTGRSKR